MQLVLKSNGITKIVIFLSYLGVCYTDSSDFLSYQLFVYFCDVEPRDFFFQESHTPIPEPHLYSSNVFLLDKLDPDFLISDHPCYISFYNVCIFHISDR